MGLRRTELVRLAVTGIGRSRARSTVTVAVMALSVIAIIASTGRTSATRTDVLTQLESPSARLMRVTDPSGRGRVPIGASDRLASVSSVEWFLALDAAGAIARNAGSGSPSTGYANGSAGIRQYTGDLLGGELGRLVAGRAPGKGEAVVGAAAARDLGLSDGRGRVTNGSQQTVGVVGEVRFAGDLNDLNDYVLVNSLGTRTGSAGEVGELIILSRTTSAVAGLAELLPGLLGPEDPRALAIEQSGELTRLRELLGLEVGELNTAILFGSLLFGAILVSVNLFGAVSARRREIGLRRTQGAERSSIAAMLMIETGVIAVVGSLVGIAVGTLVVYAQTLLAPDIILSLSAATLVSMSAIIGSLPPAVAASMQEPLYALRE